MSIHLSYSFLLQDREHSLIYADLDLSNSAPPMSRSHQDEPTEYVSIDHVRTAQRQHEDNMNANSNEHP